MSNPPPQEESIEQWEEKARDVVFDDANSVNSCGHCGNVSDLHSIADAVAVALSQAYESGLEDAAKKLDASAEHHAEADKHPAWDSMRVDAEPLTKHQRTIFEERRRMGGYAPK